MAISSLSDLIDELEAIHAQSVDNLRTALSAYLQEGVRPDPDGRALGRFAYPALKIAYDPEGAAPRVDRAFARVPRPGVYGTSLTRPGLFRDYLLEQIELLVRDYGVIVSVDRSAQEIPYPCSGRRARSRSRWRAGRRAGALLPLHPAGPHRR